MKKLLLLVLFVSSAIAAQSKYQQGMQKAFQLWEEGKMTEASQLFERISNAEPLKWKPAYYAAMTEILSSFGLKDEKKTKRKIDKSSGVFGCC